MLWHSTWRPGVHSAGAAGMKHGNSDSMRWSVDICLGVPATQRNVLAADQCVRRACDGVALQLWDRWDLRSAEPHSHAGSHGASDHGGLERNTAEEHDGHSFAMCLMAETMALQLSGGGGRETHVAAHLQGARFC